MNILTSAALDIATREVGVVEIGRNRGPRVEQYQAAAGAHPGDPWCASFVTWCFMEAARELSLANPCPVTPGALKLWRKSDEWAHWHRPSPGSIFVIDHGGGMGHCGFVDGLYGDDYYTVEGNTNEAGGREGDGVHKRKRSTVDKGLVGFIDFARLPGALPVGEV